MYVYERASTPSVVFFKTILKTIFFLKCETHLQLARFNPFFRESVMVFSKCFAKSTFLSDQLLVRIKPRERTEVYYSQDGKKPKYSVKTLFYELIPVSSLSPEVASVTPEVRSFTPEVAPVIARCLL